MRMEIIRSDASDLAECHDGERVNNVDCEQCAVRNRMLFAGIDIPSATILLKPVRHVWYDPGETLYRQGDDSTTIYSVRRGVIKLSLTSADGALRIVRLIGPGAAIGLEALVGQHLQHQAEAITPTDVCRIPIGTIKELSRQQPLLCQRLMTQWQEQMTQADENLLQLSTGSIKTRVHSLMQIMDRLCREGDIDFQLPSNPDIAGLVAARVESVSRIMAEFKRSKVLVRDKRGKWIPSPRADQKLQ
jgi:CRP-like cAMP-binding protein